MIKYVVTGATSFIGVELCKGLLANNNYVYAICRKTSKNISEIPNHKNLQIIYTDLEHLNQLTKNINNADVLINLAWSGATSKIGRELTDIQIQNAENSIKAIKIANDLHCKLFVESGSQAEYGYVPSLITEKTVCNPETEYGKAKLKVWNEGSILCKALNLKYIHLRIFSVTGEKDHENTLIISTIKKMLNNEAIDLSPCTQMWNFIYVDDAVNEIYELCKFALYDKDFKQEIFHIASNDTRELKSFVEEMRTISKSTSILNYGKINSTKKVSLMPSIKKLNEVIHYNEFVPFNEIIRRIILNININDKR